MSSDSKQTTAQINLWILSVATSIDTLTSFPHGAYSKYCVLNYSIKKKTASNKSMVPFINESNLKHQNVSQIIVCLIYPLPCALNKKGKRFIGL